MILAPTSSFLPLATEVAAERRMYLPLIAVVVPVVVALGKTRKFVWPVLILVCGTLAFLRNADYRTAETIWRDAVENRPGNVRAIVNLATFVKPAEAVGLYERALKLAPDSAEAHYNLGIILAGQKRLVDALPHLQRAAELSPRSALAQYQLALVLAQAGEMPAAEAAVRRALLLEPGSVKAQQLLSAIEQRK
jgi:tetratricopeptide (TPR) repeat protein